MAAGTPLTLRTGVVAAAATATLKRENRLGTSAAGAIEDAMIAAVLQCAKEGISDPAEILRRKLAARDEIKNRMKSL